MINLDGGFAATGIRTQSACGGGDGVALPPVLSPALLYDTATDTWTANVDGSPVTLAWDALEGQFLCTNAACGATAYNGTSLNTYGDGVTEYGALGILLSYTEAPTYDSGSVLLAFYGLRTTDTSMPQSGGAGTISRAPAYPS